MIYKLHLKKYIYLIYFYVFQISVIENMIDLSCVFDMDVDFCNSGTRKISVKLISELRTSVAVLGHVKPYITSFSTTFASQ